jgi:hypothetical protein
MQEIIWNHKETIWDFKRNWSQHYNIWKIKKSDGTKRIIHAPDAKLKKLQQEIKSYLSTFSVHPSAIAYQKNGARYIEALRKHAEVSDSHWWIEVDIYNFFGHITSELLINSGIPKEIVELITIPHHKRGRILPQGSPSSPMASNIALKTFDEEILSLLPNESIYTRYADNIGISVPIFISRRELENIILSLLTPLRFKLNIKKTKYSQPKNPRSFLGITIVNKNLCIPRKYLSKLRSKANYLLKGQAEVSSYDGMLSYIKFFSPAQYEKEISKYELLIHN